MTNPTVTHVSAAFEEKGKTKAEKATPWRVSVSRVNEAKTRFVDIHRFDSEEAAIAFRGEVAA